MEEIEPWKDWTMETILADQGTISPMMGGSSKNKFRSKNGFGEIVLGTESEMRVDESILDQLSSLSGRFTINDIELKETDFFAVDSPSPDAVVGQKSISSLGGVSRDTTNSIQFSNPDDSRDSSHLINNLPNADVHSVNRDSSRTETDSSRLKPLPPFHHFRLPPPPPPPHISPRDGADVARFADDLVNAIQSDVVSDAGIRLNASLAREDPTASKTLTSEETKTRFHLSNCSSAPSTIPPFKSKGKGSRLFSRDRRATLDSPAAPDSWISPQSALLTVLTRDLYPPASELVLPPPQGGVDLEKYYAVFLPKNLSDDQAKGTVENPKVSSIPTLLGRSASTESLHKDRLLPLLDDFFDCGDIEFSTKSIFHYSSSSPPPEEISERSRRSNPTPGVGDVGFYLDSNSPSENRGKMNESLGEGRWVPYFGDPKVSLLSSSFSPSTGSSLASHAGRNLSSSSTRHSEPNTKRSRSAEPTKTEERNEKAKKYLRVRFADSEGMDLAKSRNFCMTDDLRIPTRVLEPLRCGIEKGLPSVGVRHFFPRNFNLESRAKKDEEKLIKERKVVLREVHITPDLILGTVVVGNVSSDHKKNVFIRCTYNDWNSFVDIPAGHLSCDSMTSTSSFSFALGIPRDFVKGDVLEFAVGYTGMGRIYWDNNDGTNYVVECFARQCPLHSEDRSWISFI